MITVSTTASMLVLDLLAAEGHEQLSQMFGTLAGEVTAKSGE
jgi:hypothetical protein